MSQVVGHSVARVIGERNFGCCQYLRDRLRGGRPSELAFNRQQGRQQLFLDIVQALDFDEIVETGTFRGDTSSFMAHGSGLPVFTCESSPRHFGYARTRFAFDPAIRVALSDSRAFLRAHLAADGAVSRARFAYLDAHWGPELPLYDETRILLGHASDVVVMIDDFEVSDDPGYGFDSYGPNATLNRAYLRLSEIPAVRAYFPALRSGDETGARRGCIVLTKAGRAAEALDSLPSLRLADPC